MPKINSENVMALRLGVGQFVIIETSKNIEIENTQ